ncbi:gtpase-activator protein for Ras family gtpase [Pelomyxa schiedti]|nr:gtpase-activator protein for Ras family gtpase [Pelomyxa schiedti]
MSDTEGSQATTAEANAVSQSVVADASTVPQQRSHTAGQDLAQGDVKNTHTPRTSSSRSAHKKSRSTTDALLKSADSVLHTQPQILQEYAQRHLMRQQQAQLLKEEHDKIAPGAKQNSNVEAEQTPSPSLPASSDFAQTDSSHCHHSHNHGSATSSSSSSSTSGVGSGGSEKSGGSTGSSGSADGYRGGGGPRSSQYLSVSSCLLPPPSSLSCARAHSSSPDMMGAPGTLAFTASHLTSSSTSPILSSLAGSMPPPPASRAPVPPSLSLTPRLSVTPTIPLSMSPTYSASGSSGSALPEPVQSAKFSLITQMLLSPGMELTTVIGHYVLCKEKTASPLASLILKFYSAHNILQKLLCWAINREVQQAMNAANLFRSSGIATRLLASFYKIEAQSYLQYCLQPTLSQLGTLQNLEIDPIKVSAAQLSTNVSKLVEILEHLTERIVNSVNECPMQFRWILKSAYQIMMKKYPEQSKPIAVGGFVFLRFFCPALVSPESNGLLTDPPSPDARRNLVLISKTLQWLACQTTSDNKEEYMTLLSDFVGQAMTPVSQFFDKITDVIPSDGPLELCPVQPLSSILSDICDVIKQNLQEIVAGLLKDFPHMGIADQLKSMFEGETTLAKNFFTDRSEEESKRSVLSGIDKLAKSWENKASHVTEQNRMLQEEKILLEKSVEDLKAAVKMSNLELSQLNVKLDLDAQTKVALREVNRIRSDDLHSFKEQLAQERQKREHAKSLLKQLKKQLECLKDPTTFEDEECKQYSSQITTLIERGLALSRGLDDSGRAALTTSDQTVIIPGRAGISNLRSSTTRIEESEDLDLPKLPLKNSTSTGDLTSLADDRRPVDEKRKDKASWLQRNLRLKKRD